MRDWLSHRVVSSPDDAALIRAEDGEAWSYTDLDRLVSETAGRLVAHGMGEGDRIGVLTPPYVGTVGLVHATMRIGGTFVPLGEELTPREIAARVDRTDLDAVVCAAATEPTATDAASRIDGVPVYSVDDPASADVTAVHDVDPASLDPPEWSFEDPLCVLFTSGTTGDPKPVPLTAGNVYSSAVASGFRLGVEADDRWLVSLSLHHMGGLAPVYRSVLYGTTLVLREGFDAGGTADDIDAYDVTGVSLVPTMLRRMLDRRGTLSDSLRVVLLGGAPAPAELLERCRDYSIPVYPTYGMTEAASQITTATPRQTRDRIGTVGRPLFGTDVTVVGDDGDPVAPGETGEIAVSGPTITPGYLVEAESEGSDPSDGPGETDERDGPAPDSFGVNGIDPADIDRSDFGPYGLHTGDVGRFDESGYLHVLNRVDDRIITGGENVEPGEVADVLREYAEVDDVAVVGLDDDTWGERVAALLAVGDRFPSVVPDAAPVGGVSAEDDSTEDDTVEDDSAEGDREPDDSGSDDSGADGSEQAAEGGSPADGTADPGADTEVIGPSPVDEAAFLAFARMRLAGFKIPKTVAYVEELPRTVSGTVDREATRTALRERGVDLRERVDAGLETAGFEPADPTEPPEERTPEESASEGADGAPDDAADDGDTDAPETASVGDIIEDAEGGDIIEDAEGGDGFADDRGADGSGNESDEADAGGTLDEDAESGDAGGSGDSDDRT
ncbi:MULTISPECIES: class I adenylate-forming enzyme family protein [Halorubrum]|uniref:AMP-dependent synthetase and ligase n=1 Tax=Halorubrum hochstenium ATCC 700873 TaxID=1227481 RepID=M0FS57_9EURY|nr:MULTISPECIES: AMP-binding protein [Halorubrum]ELZ62148.1 AMP-dependent synthetase and ligase [Halorubrum hochstenium ATCC 700873]